MKLSSLNKNESDLLYDFKEIEISDTKMSNLRFLWEPLRRASTQIHRSIVKHIDNTIKTLYRGIYPDVYESDSDGHCNI